ncbi:MAG: dTDP-4-dehydrorhamnose reductase, partial [Candidatus Eisenbacteria bacterium]|nr:dTDP-4-dehydrorhamnose reductase [Candidatus Eisenbacteria bacterium]
VVLHLAAETRVDWCEEHAEEAFRVNTAGTALVARAAEARGARLVFVSTDYVFDGAARSPYSEDHATRALNVYGRSKEEAEKAVASTAGDRLIVRSSGLYGAGGKNFVDTIRAKAHRGERLAVVDDQVQSPTWVGDLAPALVRAALSGAQGILHLASDGGGCSWFDFAREILAQIGSRIACDPIPASRAGRPAPRPAYSVLDVSRARDTLSIRMPHWRDGLTRYLSGGER